MDNKSSRQTSEHVEECVDLQSCAASDDSQLVWEAVSCLTHQSSLPIAAPTMADNKSHMPLNPRNRMPHNLPPALSSLGHSVTCTNYVAGSPLATIISSHNRTYIQH